MAYPYIASGQNMKKEASDELASLERHGLLMIVVGIITPQEGNSAVPEIKDSVIADRDPVSISAEIPKDTLGAIKGRFAIDDPLLMIEMFPEGFEVSGLVEMTDTSGEYEISRFEAVFEEVEKLAAEQCRHDPYVNEEAFAA